MSNEEGRDWKGIVIIILGILAMIGMIILGILHGYAATTYELSMMSYGNMSQSYMKLGQQHDFIEWSTAYDRISENVPIKDELKFDIFAWLPVNFFITGSYDKEFVADYAESTIGAGWERIIPQVEWKILGLSILKMRDNIDMAVSALWNEQVYAMPWIENRADLKILGLFYTKNVLGAYFPIGTDMRLKCETNLSIKVLDPTGTLPIGMDIVLTNISELNKNSTNRIGCQIKF
ncbi:MAG: hypothetical protein PHY56_00275 [Candidatus Omnitrophica bacterium]|nr:hypothetical protein [Candidatus Omnitrophota bacterium]